MSKQISVRIPDALNSALRSFAKGRGQDLADVVRNILIDEAFETGIVFQCQLCHKLSPSHERHSVGEMVAVCERCWADELAKEQ